MAALWLQRACLLMALWALVPGTEQVTLCGGELVDAIQFVCGERRGGSANRLSRRDERRMWNTLIEQCCHRECSIEVLEEFCQTVYQRT